MDSINTVHNKNLKNSLSSNAVEVKHLTENVKPEHIIEIFQAFGKFISVTKLEEGKIKVVYEHKAGARKAVKMMDGGRGR